MRRSTEPSGDRSPGSGPGSAPLLKAAGGSALAGLLVFVLPGSAPGTPGFYPEGAPPGHSGGFGDPTCRACHADYPLNEPGGSVEILGLPGDGYRAGDSYELQVVLRRKGMGRAGFQATARRLRGDGSGTGAGALAVPGERVERVEDPESGVAYVQQSRAGTEPTPDQDEARWRFRWVAPAAGTGPVVFHVAANAGNDDASEFGDRIYADSVVVEERTGASTARW